SIAVTLATPTCARATPTVTASPASQTAPAGSTVAYTISVTNNDGPACLPTTFDLDTWTFGSIGWSLTPEQMGCSCGDHCTVVPAPLSPGASATTAMTLTSPAGATGSFGFPVTSTNHDNGSYRSSISPAYVIGTSTSSTTGSGATGTPLTVSVSTDKTSYTG